MALMRRTLPAVLISCRCSGVSGPFPTRATVAEALTMLHSWSGEPQRKGALGTSACLSHSGAGHHLLRHSTYLENHAMAGAHRVLSLEVMTWRCLLYYDRLSHV